MPSGALQAFAGCSHMSQSVPGSDSFFSASITSSSGQDPAAVSPVTSQTGSQAHEAGPASLGLAHISLVPPVTTAVVNCASEPAAVAQAGAAGHHGVPGVVSDAAIPVSSAPAKAPRRRRAASKNEEVMPPVIEPTLELLDRDQSILVFNERVLSWAEREDVPLLERLRYLCIVSSNLDEWFEVRCATLRSPCETRRIACLSNAGMMAWL